MPRSLTRLTGAVASSLKFASPANSPALSQTVSEEEGTALASIPKAAPTFHPRQTFTFPSTIPSWYIGHMYRALRSLPALLARDPPPLVIEARDARLPLSSINPAFEEQLRLTFDGTAGSRPYDTAQGASSEENSAQKWQGRRLVVYIKRDLIDRRIEAPLKRAFAKHGDGQEVLFVNTKNDSDVREILRWVRKRAQDLVKGQIVPVKMSRSLAKAQRTVSGAFKHTSTPDKGVRLVILGMPNVGKSSLLNALRRVGTGKGKAASTAPVPGHTRKLTGTVRITKEMPVEKKDFRLDDGAENAKNRNNPVPPIYVYDTPGVMIPFLGSGQEGAEKGVKLAAAAGIKSALFDSQGLADYLLFRMNLRYGWETQQWASKRLNRAEAQKAAADKEQSAPLPFYLRHLPLPKARQIQPTNDITELLEWVAERAPGTMLKGGRRDLEASANFLIQRWRDGKMGPAELDLGIGELPASLTTSQSFDRLAAPATLTETDGERIDRLVEEHFAKARMTGQGVIRSVWSRSTEASALAARDVIPSTADTFESKNQARKQRKAAALKESRQKVRTKGMDPSISKSQQERLYAERQRHREWLIKTKQLKLRGTYGKMKSIIGSRDKHPSRRGRT